MCHASHLSKSAPLSCGSSTGPFPRCNNPLLSSWLTPCWDGNRRVRRRNRLLFLHVFFPLSSVWLTRDMEDRWTPDLPCPGDAKSKANLYSRPTILHCLSDARPVFLTKCFKPAKHQTCSRGTCHCTHKAHFCFAVRLSYGNQLKNRACILEEWKGVIFSVI